MRRAVIATWLLVTVLTWAMIRHTVEVQHAAEVHWARLDQRTTDMAGFCQSVMNTVRAGFQP